jgi:hypothetical protein
VPERRGGGATGGERGAGTGTKAGWGPRGRYVLVMLMLFLSRFLAPVIRGDLNEFAPELIMKRSWQTNGLFDVDVEFCLQPRFNEGFRSFDQIVNRSQIVQRHRPDQLRIEFI